MKSIKACLGQFFGECTEGDLLDYYDKPLQFTFFASDVQYLMTLLNESHRANYLHKELWLICEVPYEWESGSIFEAYDNAENLYMYFDKVYGVEHKLSNIEVDPIIRKINFRPKLENYFKK